MQTVGTKFLTYNKHKPINLAFVKYIGLGEKAINFYFIDESAISWIFEDERSANKAKELLVKEVSEIELEDF